MDVKWWLLSLTPTFQIIKKLINVAIDLEIPAKKAVKLWSQFLKLERKYDAYEFYKDCEYQIPRLLIINNFIKNNHVNINNIADVMKNVKNLFGLQLHISIIKYEIEELKQTKNNLRYSQDKHALKKLSEINRNYPKYRI